MRKKKKINVVFLLFISSIAFLSAFSYQYNPFSSGIYTGLYILIIYMNAHAVYIKEKKKKEKK